MFLVAATMDDFILFWGIMTEFVFVVDVRNKVLSIGNEESYCQFLI